MAPPCRACGVRRCSWWWDFLNLWRWEFEWEGVIGEMDGVMLCRVMNEGTSLLGSLNLCCRTIWVVHVNFIKVESCEINELTELGARSDQEGDYWDVPPV